MFVLRGFIYTLQVCYYCYGQTFYYFYGIGYQLLISRLSAVPIILDILIYGYLIFNKGVYYIFQVYCITGFFYSSGYFSYFLIFIDGTYVNILNEDNYFFGFYIITGLSSNTLTVFNN